MQTITVSSCQASGRYYYYYYYYYYYSGPGYQRTVSSAPSLVPMQDVIPIVYVSEITRYYRKFAIVFRVYKVSLAKHKIRRL